MCCATVSDQEMNYYVLQVETGVEERFITLTERNPELHSPEGPPFRFWWPRRHLTIRRRGKVQKSLAPLFPGYLILEAESFPSVLFSSIRRTSGFIRFLRSNTDITPLEGRQKEILRHLLRLGEIVEQSKVTFDVNNRIQVTEGPLKGMEGQIVKINRRKGRAKVRLDLYENSFLVDLGFETMESTSNKKGKTVE